MTCFDSLYLKKSRSAYSVLEQNIDISFGPNGAPLNACRAVMVHSARRIALLLAPFDVALPSKREKPS